MIDVSTLNGKVVKGTVVSDKVDKTIVVLVEYQKKDPRFHKVVYKSKRIMAHDPANKAKVGNLVQIQECRPISKRKAFILVDVIS